MRTAVSLRERPSAVSAGVPVLPFSAFQWVGFPVRGELVRASALGGFHLAAPGWPAVFSGLLWFSPSTCFVFCKAPLCFLRGAVL